MRLTGIVCTYNHADCLEACLDAILAQSRPLDELIVVDDGSTDATAAILERRAQACAYLRIITHPTNRGLIAAGATGFAAARGDYVATLASDDRVMPGFFAAADEAARRHGKGVICGSTRILSGTQVREYRLDLPGAALEPGQVAALLAEDYHWFATSGAFLRRDLVEAMAGWQPDLEVIADWFLVYGAALRAGLVALPMVTSEVAESPASLGAAAWRDPARRRAMRRAFLRHLARPANSDLRRAFRAAPLAAVVPLGNGLIAEALRHPATWDLALSWATRRARDFLVRRLA